MQKLILVSGLPGTGKSTISEILAKKLALPIFSVDPIESAVIKSGFEKSFETGLAAYLIAETLAEEQLKLGLSVIIDAVNAVKEARDMWRNLSNKYNVELVIIECILESTLHKKRIESRIRNIHGIPEVTWKNVEKVRGEYLSWNDNHLTLDTSESNETNMDKILKYLNDPS